MCSFFTKQLSADSPNSSPQTAKQLTDQSDSTTAAAYQQRRNQLMITEHPQKNSCQYKPPDNPVIGAVNHAENADTPTQPVQHILNACHNIPCTAYPSVDQAQIVAGPKPHSGHKGDAKQPQLLPDKITHQRTSLFTKFSPFFPFL